MEYVALGRSGQTVSRIGFGGCPLGGFGWGDTDDRNLRNSIAYAANHGVTLFDTADIYGLGQSERILGEELRGRDKVVIATKFGVRRIGDKTIHDNSAAWIEEALNASLARLRRETVDIYQLHYWDGHTPFADILATIERLRALGKLRWFGVTNVDPREHMVGPLPDWIVSFSNECSLVQRKYAAMIDSLGHDQGLTFFSWGSLAQGALSGKYSANHRFDTADRRSREDYPAFHGEGLARRESIVAAMREIQKDHSDRSLAQIAIRWVLDRYAGSVALVGIKRAAQIADAVGATGWSLSATEIARLTDLTGVVREPPASDV